ncbi:MAG: alternative ribosome rescue aminoacyl-tRNA hydrolase ArfB [Planctomycetota bacterium]
MADLRITGSFVIPTSELQWSAARSGGPGGQNVNKVNSKITLRWKLKTSPGFSTDWRRRFEMAHANQINREGEIVLHSDATRDQSRNLNDARDRLKRWLLACRFPPKKRMATRPTLGSKRRRLDHKKQQSQKKQNRRSIRHDD